MCLSWTAWLSREGSICVSARARQKCCGVNNALTVAQSSVQATDTLFPLVCTSQVCCVYAAVTRSLLMGSLCCTSQTIFIFTSRPMAQSVVACTVLTASPSVSVKPCRGVYWRCASATYALPDFLYSVCLFVSLFPTKTFPVLLHVRWTSREWGQAKQKRSFLALQSLLLNAQSDRHCLYTLPIFAMWAWRCLESVHRTEICIIYLYFWVSLRHHSAFALSMTVVVDWASKTS